MPLGPAKIPRSNQTPNKNTTISVLQFQIICRMHITLTECPTLFPLLRPPPPPHFASHSFSILFYGLYFKLFPKLTSDETVIEFYSVN